jgi:uncharacterized protein (TIGR00369 family)
MDTKALQDFLANDFPQVNAGGAQAFTVVEVAEGSATVRLDPDQRHLRPGGTISGPTLFGLADFAAYMAILAAIGPVALAVTTNLNINFLRKAGIAPVLGTARILKLGKRLAVIDIAMESEGDLIAHATATYSIPPRVGR